MRNKFDMQLDSLKEQLTTMGELCEVAFRLTRRSTRRKKTLRDFV